MKNNRLCLIAVPVICLALIGVGFAQRPETNIDPARHPNLAEAQHHILQAFEKIDEAQRTNNDQLGGHAEKPSSSSIKPAVNSSKPLNSRIAVGRDNRRCLGDAVRVLGRQEVALTLGRFSRGETDK